MANLTSFGALHNKAGRMSPAMREYTLELERVLRSSLASVNSSGLVRLSSGGGGGSTPSSTCADRVCTWHLSSTSTISERVAITWIIIEESGELIFTDENTELVEIP